MSNDETNLNLEIVGRLCQTPRRFAETPYNLCFVIFDVLICCKNEVG